MTCLYFWVFILLTVHYGYQIITLFEKCSTLIIYSLDDDSGVLRDKAIVSLENVMVSVGI